MRYSVRRSILSLLWNWSEDNIMCMMISLTEYLTPTGKRQMAEYFQAEYELDVKRSAE